MDLQRRITGHTACLVGIAYATGVLVSLCSQERADVLRNLDAERAGMQIVCCRAPLRRTSARNVECRWGRLLRPRFLAMLTLKI